MKYLLKKTFAILLSIAMVLSMTTIVMAEETEPQLIPEVDLVSTQIYANGVAITIEAGETAGTSKIKYGDNLYLDLDATSPSVQQEADLSDYHIYGGSKNASVSNTSITMNGGTVSNIYGAGCEGNASAENTSVTVNGGTVSTVYGGGAWGGASAENTSVTISGGTVACVYGGGSDGAVRGDTTVTISGNAEILASDDAGFSGNVYGGGESSSATVSSAFVTMDGGTVTKIYGGGFSGAISGNTSVTVNDGTVSAVYGGGRFCAVSGDTSVTVNDGTVTDVYGGGSSGSSSISATVDSTSVTISYGTVTNVYGGGESDSDTVNGDTSVTINGCTSTMAAIYGGGNSGAVSGDTSVSVSGGAAVYIYGGGNESGSTVGITSVNISGGGTFRGVFGGGRLGGVNDGTSVTVSGGTVIEVYGGGSSGAVNGDTSVNITGTAKFTTTSSGTGGNIYGGGFNGAVNGSTFVTVSSGTFVTVNNTTINQNVYGDGCEPGSTVTGSKNGYVTLADKVNADSFTNLLHKTNDGWELSGSAIIPENQTMTIGNSETFTINEGETLTNNGTLVVAGTLTGAGTLAGDGTFKKSLTEGDNITIENVVYTGAEITPIINNTTIMGTEFVYDTTEYTPTYQKKNGENWEIIDKVKESGDYKITFTKDSSTVSAEFKVVVIKSTGGGSSGGSGSSGGGTIITPSATPEITLKVPTTVTNGTATATVSDKSVADAITKAQAEAKKNGIFIELNVDTRNKTVDSVTAILLKNSVDQLVKAGVKEVSIKSVVADIRLNLETLKKIQKTAGSDVNISAKKVDNNTLSAEAKKVVGNRPIFDFSITGKNGEKVSDFGKGSVSVSIPYTLGSNENPANVVAYYIDVNGKVKEMPNSVYDAKTKTLDFVTDHFSQFAVGYKNTTVTFSDIENHWAKESIEFVSERGLFSGTGNGKFSPNLSMTRGMFVTALGRLAEVDTKAYTKSSFTDVKTDAYYMSYVEWANKNGIVKGVSTTTFAPDQKITREQMAVILANYAKSIGLDLPQVHKENIFADNNKSSDWAKKAVKEMQISGVISGKSNNVFDPQGTATRAEASTMLKRLVEIQ